MMVVCCGMEVVSSKFYYEKKLIEVSYLVIITFVKNLQLCF